MLDEYNYRSRQESPWKGSRGRSASAFAVSGAAGRKRSREVVFRGIVGVASNRTAAARTKRLDARLPGILRRRTKASGSEGKVQGARSLATRRQRHRL